VKPFVENIKRFKNSLGEMSYSNRDENNNGFKSLSIINYSIPYLRQELKKHNIKVSYSFLLDFNKDTYREKRIPYTTKNKIISNVNEIKDVLHSIIEDMKYMITEKLEIEGSGNTFSKVINATINVGKYNPLKIKSYLPLPKEIFNKKCCINIKNDDDKCFMYCLLYHIFKPQKNPQELYSYNKFKETEIYKKLTTLKYPVAIKDIKKLKKSLITL
jgi:hypothetical protein